MTANALIKELKKAADKDKAKLLAGFFKTGKGHYGEGDKFLGVMVPRQRIIAKKYQDLKLADLQILLNSPFHEVRLTALLILTYKYPRATLAEKQKIVAFYFKNTRNINNWDLVDLTAPNILGDYFLDKDRAWLYKYIKSKVLWERRIAVLACARFIRRHDFQDILKISELLLHDQHDLMHKAVGWMLREVGKRDKKVLQKFLNQHYKKMPRTMLRYAIEKFPEAERQFYLKK